MHTIATAGMAKTAALAGLVVLALAGCSTSAGDRAGGDTGADIRVLSFAQAGDGIGTPLTQWADQVARRAHGTLRIEFKDGWRSGEPTAEAGIISDVGKRKVDLAWVGARVWDRVGVTSFQPLIAPMLIDSQALQAKVFSSGIAAKALDGVDASGLVGLGVLPGPLRKMLGVSTPFLKPADFAGRVIGIQDGLVAQQTFEALGATPRAVPAGAELTGLAGYEQQLGSIWGNHYELSAKYVTANVNLWPRPLVLFTSEGVMASLTASQRSALRQAASATLPSATVSARADDQRGIPGLCDGGMRFTSASTPQLRSLRAAVQPVYDALNANPGTRAVIGSILALKTRLHAAPDSATCAGQPKQASPSVESEAIPDGTYQMILTDAEAKQCAGDEGNPGRRFDLKLANGGVQLYEKVGAGPWELGWSGSYRLFRDRFELVESSDHTMTAHWAFDGKALTLSDLRNGECGDAIVWTTHPWVLKRGT